MCITNKKKFLLWYNIFIIIYIYGLQRKNKWTYTEYG